jgi:hypothetical protein
LLPGQIRQPKRRPIDDLWRQGGNKAFMRIGEIGVIGEGELVVEGIVCHAINEDSNEINPDSERVSVSGYVK